jgi:hypothetical protein
LALVPLLIFVHVKLGLEVIQAFSPTYDEPIHLTAGYVYLKTGHYLFNGGDHPAFAEMWAALPLLYLNPAIPFYDDAWMKQTWTQGEKNRFANRFLYHNRISADQIVTACRKMQLVLSVILGMAIGLAALQLGGSWCGLLAFLFWTFSPDFLSHGTLVTTDLAFAIFFFLFFFSLWRIRSYVGIIISGISLGLCFASKYFALAIIPCLAGLALWDFVFRSIEERKPAWEIFSATSSQIKKASAILFLAALVLCLVYRFTDFDVYMKGLMSIVSRSQEGRHAFFGGRYGSHGWILYFPVLLILKTPIPILLGLLLTVILAAMKKVSIPLQLWIPPLVFLVVACFSKVQIGHRYILCVSPFLIVLASFGYSYLSGWGRIFHFIAPAWLFMNMWQTRPNYLAFFNELIGGPSQGYHYFTDSNVDWGQGLKLLAQNLDKEDLKNGIYLSYFGTGDPHFYGIQYIDVGSLPPTENSGGPDLRPTKFAISVTNLQGTYYQSKDVFRWLDQYSPLRMVAYSMFVYDFSNHPEAIKKLENLRNGGS